MAFSSADIKRFRKAVSSASRPLILFDDDCDGLTSFIMLYRAIGDGRGLPVKKSPKVGSMFIRKVEEFGPDIIFILDKPKVSEEFFENVRVPIVWLDHHEPQEIKHKHVDYFNPRVADDKDNRPTSYWVNEFVGKENDLWLAAIGAVGDWFVPDFLKQVKKRWPELLPKKWKTIGDLYLDTKLGDLILIVSLLLKGTVAESLTNIKTLLRIEDPFEILDQSTPRGKYVWRRYERLARDYRSLRDRAVAAGKKQRGKYLLFLYHDDMSFTKELSNELLLRFPKKIIILGRQSTGEVKASFRSSGPPIDKAIAKALDGVRGHGGGHTHACGSCIIEDDWETFLKQFKQAMRKTDK